MMTPKQIIDELYYYYQVGYNRISPDTALKINALVQAILHTFADSEFQPTKSEIRTLIAVNHVLANVVSMSTLQTTDSVLRGLSGQPGKQMILCTIRNQIYIDPKEFFDYDAELASLWFDCFLECAAGRTSELLYNNSVRHLMFTDPRYQPTVRTATNYFLPNYIDPKLIPKVKSIINYGFQRIAPKFDNRPTQGHIALIVDRWVPGHAVYKSMYGLIEALAKKYPVTLVALGPYDGRIDTTLFTDVKRVELKDTQLDVSHILYNDFHLAFFCDIGMSIESIMLANCRVCPIQVTGHGHPVSTFGAEMDYFISGKAAEKLDCLSKNYSEKVILLPGSGNHPEKPNYVPKRPPKATPLAINCPWGAAKYNYDMLRLLRDIQQSISIPIKYHFFPGCGVNRYNAAYPYLRDMSNIFKDEAVQFPNQPYSQYMENLELGSFSLDSYPFGSYNSIVDSLYLGIPVITWEGDEWYNRVSSYLLRQIGLNELIATNEQEYINLIKKMIMDVDFRHQMVEKVQQADLSVLFEANEPKYFVKAIEKLLI